MAENRKPNATGRSSGTYARKVGKHLKPQGPFVALTREVLESPAWRGLSPNGRRLMDRLMIEHVAHAGLENGRLPVTHADLEAYGLCRNYIRAAIDEAEAFGLIRFQRGGRWGGVKRPSLFRITFLGTRDAPPTDEWRTTSEETVKAWKRRARPKQKTGGKKQISTPQSRSPLPPDWRVYPGRSEGPAQ